MPHSLQGTLDFLGRRKSVKNDYFSIGQRDKTIPDFASMRDMDLVEETMDLQLFVKLSRSPEELAELTTSKMYQDKDLC